MRKVLSFPGSKVISVHDSDRSASKEGKDKGVHGCGFSALRHKSRPLLVVAPLKMLFPQQQLRFFTFVLLLLHKGFNLRGKSTHDHTALSVALKTCG